MKQCYIAYLHGIKTRLTTKQTKKHVWHVSDLRTPLPLTSIIVKDMKMSKNEE